MKFRLFLLASVLAGAALSAGAHPLSITQVLASFERPGLVDVKMDIDLTPLLPSPEAYAAIAAAPSAAQKAAVDQLLPEIVSSLRLQIGSAPLRLILQDFKIPALPREAMLDPTADHFTLLHFIAALPSSREPVRLAVKRGTQIAYPIAFIVQIPAAHLSDASWIQDETEESDAIDWAKSAPQAGAVPAVTHLFLLIGQSNMAGRGPVGAEDRTPDPRVFALGQNQEWRPAIDPLAFDKPELVGVGPGLAFGKAVARAHPDWVVGLVPAAFGGSSLDEWKPGSRLYRDAVARAQAALAGGGRLDAILWHQGESDAKPELAATYVARFQVLAASLRRDLGAPEVPLIAGEIGHFVAGGEPINRQLALLPSTVPHCRLVSSAGLTDKGDHLHFDAPSARELGRRYAAAFAAGAER